MKYAKKYLLLVVMTFFSLTLILISCDKNSSVSKPFSKKSDSDSPTASAASSTTETVTATLTETATSTSITTDPSAEIKENMRTRLTEDTTYYLDYDNGNDANDCLDATPEHACKTPQHVIDHIANNVDLAGYNVKIQAAANQTYAPPVGTAALSFRPLVGSGYITFDGGGSTILTTKASCIQTIVSVPQQIYIQNVQLQTQGSLDGSEFKDPANGMGIFAASPSFISLREGIVFKSTVTFHIAATSPGASIQILNDYTIEGGGLGHLQAAIMGNIQAAGWPIRVKIRNTPNFSAAFAFAVDMGSMFLHNMYYEIGGITLTSKDASGNTVPTWLYLVQSNSLIHHSISYTDENADDWKKILLDKEPIPTAWDPAWGVQESGGVYKSTY